MIQLRTILLCCLLGVLVRAQNSDDVPELSSILSLFSAHATGNSVRVNWTLDRQSPTIQTFRIYRGYEEIGNFAVLAEVNSHEGISTTEYALTDTSAVPSVSYYYKLAAVGQSSESVFPVVISATVPSKDPAPGLSSSVPAAIIPGEKISLYVRKSGKIKLDILLPTPRALVNDSLRPGIYQFDAPVTGTTPLTLKLNHENGYDTEIKWPIQ